MVADGRICVVLATDFIDFRFARIHVESKHCIAIIRRSKNIVVNFARLKKEIGLLICQKFVEQWHKIVKIVKFT